MKIHNLASPPAGITFEPLTVETVKVQKTVNGVRQVEVMFRTAKQQPVSATFSFAADNELPSPDDVINYSFWRPTP